MFITFNNNDDIMIDIITHMYYRRGGMLYYYITLCFYKHLFTIYLLNIFYSLFI
jgi:hypothetical protein